MTTDRAANLGQCFIAVDPEMFAPGFSDRLQDLMDFLRKMEPVSVFFIFMKLSDELDDRHACEQRSRL